MDQAWALEEDFWRAVATGQPHAFYREHMVADGFVVMPNRIASRAELVARWEQIAPARRCEISDPVFTVLEGGNLVITYRVSMDAEWIGDYEAFMTAVYTVVGGRWRLICRAHTPIGGFPFER